MDAVKEAIERTTPSEKPLVGFEEAAPISQELWRRLERMRPSAALRFFESLTPADESES